MKYIRTKDGIFKVLDYTSNCGESYYKIKPEDDGWIWACSDDILKVADTIEELIDEYVVVENKSHNIPSYLKEAINRFMEKQCGELSEDYSIEIYGAIWTDKGLIYVAKMNDKGELELL